MNFFEANLSKSGFDIGGKKIKAKLTQAPEGVEIGIRPEHLKQCRKQKAIISGELEVIEQLGDHVLAHLVTKTGNEFVAKSETIGDSKVGDTMHFDAAARNIHFFDQATGIRL